MEITIRRSTIFAAVTVALGILVTAAGAELIVRIWLPPYRFDRIFVRDSSGERGADCYPRAPGVRLPLDLGREQDRLDFARQFNVVRLGERLADYRPAGLPERERGLRADEAAALLAEVAPLCVVYEDRWEGPRRWVAAAGGKKTIALLGDSFVYGQGLEAEAAFHARLARALKVNVRSYARIGADMAEIEDQFRAALADHERLRYSRIVYVYVLNDPYRSNELEGRKVGLNDLMNVRLGYVSPWLAALNEYSALSRRLTQGVAQRIVTSRTIRWYADLNDPVANPGLPATMARLSELARQAHDRGIDFVVLVYPLMLDMAEYPLAAAHRNLRELAARFGVELHDLLPAFQARGKGALLNVHPLDLHPNGFAQSIAAEDAASYLMRRDVRP